jgi:MFS family permease
MVTHKPATIWNRAFALLCLAQFLGYAQHFVLQPTFPLYVTHLGGSPFAVGVVIASFGVTSVLLRPAIGDWADRWSETGVMIVGLLSQAASILLCLTPFVGAAVAANALRGVGWAGLNAGGYSLLASNAPPSRRAEASGYYGGVQASATIFFPAVALWIIEDPRGGFAAAFLLAAGLALVAALATLALATAIPNATRTAALEHTGSWWRDILEVFERDILLAAALLFCLHLPLPAVTSFVVLFAREAGVIGFGWFFVVTGVTSLLSRPLLGRISDRIGCGRSLIAAFVLEITGLVVLPLVPNLWGIMAAGVLFMLGSAIGSSRILALAMEKASPARRGRAMASFSVAFPLSNGVGALFCGTAVDLAGYSWMYFISAALCGSGLALTAKNWATLR